MEEEERQQQQQRQQQQHEAWSMVTRNNITHSNDANGNANGNHASVLKSAVSPLQTFLRHRGGQLQGQQQQVQQQVQQILVGGTLGNENDVTSYAWNPSHHDDEDNDDDEEYCPLPIDSDHTDVNDIRDAVDIALAQIGGDCDDSLIDLDGVEEFFTVIEEENNTNVKATTGHGDDDNFGIGNQEDRQGFNDYYSTTNHDSMESIEFAPLAGPTAVVDEHQQQQYYPVSIIEGMEVLTDGSGSVPPNNNNNSHNINMDYSSRNMGDSGHGSLASLGSLAGAFSKLNHCMQHTAQTRVMIQQLPLPNLQNDVFDDSTNHNNSCSSLPMPNLSFHSLPSAGRSNRGRPTKSLTRLTKTDLLGRSSSLRSLGSANSGGVRKASTKATLKSSSATSLRSMGSSSSKRRSSSHLRGQRYTKKRSSCSSLSTMKSDENPLVTGIAPINWDGI